MAFYVHFAFQLHFGYSFLTFVLFEVVNTDIQKVDHVLSSFCVFYLLNFLVSITALNTLALIDCLFRFPLIRFGFGFILKVEHVKQILFRFFLRNT